MSGPLATNHERIWLQPLCCIDERCWCEHPQPCDDCDLPPIEYVRADLVPSDAGVGRLRDLVQCLLDNDPSELIADGGITVLDQWRKDARAALTAGQREVGG